MELSLKQMKKTILFYPFITILLLLSSCKSSTDKDKFIDENNYNLNSEKTQIEVIFSCEEDGISQYIEDGWVIVEEYSEEKICTWKSFPATKDCDMEKDKGCIITKPDKIGSEKIYLLER